MANVKVSVIIPVYNTEAYLEQCLESVIHQTLQETEIICVDDGSEDGSQEILQRYAAADPRIQVVSQQNCGAGPARNRGISIATGEYLAFLDSDDWFDLSALEKLYSQAVKDDADICVCGRTYYIDFHGEQVSCRLLPKKSHYPREEVFNIESNPDGILTFSTGAVWDKLFRRSFVIENRISFLTARRGEDIWFASVTLCKAGRITVLDEALVHYRYLRSGSLTETVYQDAEEYIDVWLKIADELKKGSVYPQRSLANRAWTVFLTVLHRTKWPDYVNVYNEIRTKALPGLGIKPAEPGYFYAPWQEELLEHMYREDAEEFLVTYLQVMDIRIREASASRQALTEKNKTKTKELQEKIKKKDARIQKQDNQVKTQNGQINEQKEKIKEQREIIREQRETIREQKETIREQKETTKQLKEEIKKRKEEIRKLKEGIRDLKASKSFRIGRAITWVPRKAEAVLKRKEKKRS